jgi:UDP-N-acetylglucosamine 2-epimerase (non-hydrolysing)
MKVAPLIKAARAHNAACRNGEVRLDWRLIHTGQHYDAKMSDVFFQELGIPPADVNLGVGSGSHAAQTANIMLGFEPVCLSEKPDWVIVVGDVNSTMACTVVASKLGIKVAHIEAGLRSFDRTMPEEINRILTDAVADLLLTPSEDADLNLLREGIPATRVQVVGNIMIDAVVENLDKARQRTILRELSIKEGEFAYVTLHRPGNVDRQDSLSAIIAHLHKLAGQMPVVFPIHPRTRRMLADFGIRCDDARGLHVIDPVGYHDSLCLTENARLILTDSGGLQEESTYFRTPCLTLRPNTERPITVTVGSNRLTSLDRLEADLRAILAKTPRLGQLPRLWDGRTAERVLQAVIAASCLASSGHSNGVAPLVAPRADVGPVGAPRPNGHHPSVSV